MNMTVIFNTIQNIISESTGVEEDVIVPDAHFEEDLGVSNTLLLPQLLELINDQLETELEINAFLEIPYEEQTVETLARLLSEEQLLLA